MAPIQLAAVSTAPLMVRAACGGNPSWPQFTPVRADTGVINNEFTGAAFPADPPTRKVAEDRGRTKKAAFVTASGACNVLSHYYAAVL